MATKLHNYAEEARIGLSMSAQQHWMGLTVHAIICIPVTGAVLGYLSFWCFFANKLLGSVLDDALR